MITKSEGFGNCGNKIHTDFGANAFDKVNLRGNYRIASLEYNTLTNELIINQYPDVSKTVILGESSVSRNTTTSHKDAISGILEWANMSIDDFNNLDKTKNYVVYNANNPESDRYLYYTYNKGLGEWVSSSLVEGDEFFNTEDSIKYRYENNKIVNAIDVTLTARNTAIDGKSTGITLEVSPTTGDSVHLDLVDGQYAGLMSPEDKTKLDNIESNIGAVLELGNPSNGRVPLYLKTKDGEILSTVNLDEDDYIDSIIASIATQDDPDKGIKAGDKILTFTLTNGNKIVISLEGWFVYYTGLKTDAIDTVVVENKIKSTLLLDSNSDNLSEISSDGLLTKLLWQLEDKSVNFIKGLKSSYDSILYSGYIYFTTDTKEIIVNGQAYGIDLTASDLNLVEKLEEDTNIPGRIKVTKSNGGVYYINIPDVTTTSNGLMLSEDKAKLDSIEDGAQVNILEGIKINNITQPIERKVATLNVYDKSQVNSLVANGIKYKGESTSIGNLPTSKEIGDSYKITVEKLGLTTDAVVFWDGNKWSPFSGNLDLSAYATKEDLENSSSGSGAEFDKKLESKVDKVEGSSLVQDTEISKLSYIGNYVKSVEDSILSGKINLDVTTVTPSNKGAETINHIVLPESSTDHNGLMSSKHYDVIEALNLDGNYLDKTGTPSATWQLSKNTGPKIKNSGGQFELRNANDDTYADLIVKDLTITGNVTQEGSSFITQAETVEVTDNTILLNKGEVGAGVTKGYAGLEVDRGTLPLYKIYFDESDDRFKAGSGTDLWPIMLRDEEDSLTDGNILTWDATSKRAKTGKNLDTELDNYIPLSGTTDSKIISGDLVTSKSIDFHTSDGDYEVILKVDKLPIMSKNADGSITMSGASASIRGISLRSDGLYEDAWDGTDGYKLWSELNDGPDSGLDADLLDGKQGSEYALITDLETETQKYLPLAGGTMSGTILSEGPILVDKNGNRTWLGFVGAELMLGGITSESKVVFQLPRGTSLMVTNSNAVGAPRYKVWDEYNDGAGSGLDADLLDGQHASEFLSSTNGVHTGTLKVNPGAVGPYSEGIRIAKASNNWANIQLGNDVNSSDGFVDGQWIIGRNPAGAFVICEASTESSDSIPSGGLGISPDNGGLYFNGIQVANVNQIPSLSNYVTLDSAQTISGAKTFTSAVTGTEGFYDTSDVRLKSNIKEIELNSEKIRLCEFDKGDKRSYGVIAQEIEKLYPSTVQEGKDGYKVVNYNEVLTIKCAELEAENEELRNRLDKLEKLLEKIMV